MPNALARESSPYLRQHANNPVDWFPWGEEAFQRARELNKPVFLSIGYSTCHWCHVMAHESFEDEVIAAIINEHFVAIKLDREERPDVDRVYMGYVQAITGHGGWPLNVWLTPELKPFFGGTYFPPEDRPGMRGFPSLLSAIAKAWHDDRDKLVAESNRVIATLANHTRNAAAPEDAAKAPESLIDAAGAAFEKGFEYLYENFDDENGGFGGAPKFPRASNLNFLFRAAAIQGMDTDFAKEAVRMASKTLRSMAGGGIHDHVAGGFHRYSVDPSWFVPHFEKMLYDQAQIASNFLEAKQALGDETYAWVARGIFDYVLSTLQHPEGGFFAAEDADSLIDTSSKTVTEGAFYVWSKRELEDLLGGEAALVCAHFGVSDSGNVPEQYDPHGDFTRLNILHQRRSIVDTAAMFKREVGVAAERLQASLLTLREAREKRPRPHRDEKIIAAWNGLMISALARGTQVLGEPQWARQAERAANFLLETMTSPDGRRLVRSRCDGRNSGAAVAEDYAFLIQGLLDLYEATFNVRWLLWAEKLQHSMDELFADKEKGGYFGSAAGDEHLVLRLKEDYDGAEPAATSVAAMNLLRFAGFFLDEPRWKTAGLACIESLRSQWRPFPHAMPQLLCALELAMDSGRQIVFVGDPQSRAFTELAAVPHSGLGPRRTLLALTGSTANDELLRTRIPALRDYVFEAGSATAYVCEHYVCQAPAKSPAELRSALHL